MTGQAELIGRLPELRVSASTVHIMAIETGDSAPVHDALNEIVTLHAIFMRRAVGVVQKVGRCTERAFL